MIFGVMCDTSNTPEIGERSNVGFLVPQRRSRIKKREAVPGTPRNKSDASETAPEPRSPRSVLGAKTVPSQAPTVSRATWTSAVGSLPAIARSAGRAAAGQRHPGRIDIYI